MIELRPRVTVWARLVVLEVFLLGVTVAWGTLVAWLLFALNVAGFVLFLPVRLEVSDGVLVIDTTVLRHDPVDLRTLRMVWFTRSLWAEGKAAAMPLQRKVVLTSSRMVASVGLSYWQDSHEFVGALLAAADGQRLSASDMRALARLRRWYEDRVD